MTATDYIITVFKRHYKPGGIPELHSYSVLIDAMVTYHEEKRTAPPIEVLAELEATKRRLNAMTEKYLAAIDLIDPKLALQLKQS